MSNTVKNVKVKKKDGTLSDYIPIGADASNIDMQNGLDAETIIGKKPYYFNSVAAMKAAEYLKEGDCVITLGYYEPNDGGGAIYKVRTKMTGNIEDNGTIHFINSNLVVEMIVNNSILVDTFGAKGDGQTNDSSFIENAINYANNNNKKIIFSNKSYCVNKSFYIKAGISIEGNFAKIIPLKNGTFTQNYIFLLNSKDGLDWFEEWKGNANIHNLKFDNVNNVENIKAFFLAEGNVDFFQISSNKFYQLVKTPSRYLDNISFRKISCLYNYGDDYMIYKIGQGDAILFDGCHFASNSESFNNKGIYLSNSWGATIQNIINGYHYFLTCINTTIQDCHIERGNFTFVDSIINFKNSYIWKIPGTTPVIIKDSDKVGGFRKL